MNNNNVRQTLIFFYFKGDREKPEVIVITKLVDIQFVSYKSIFERTFLHHRCK